MTTNFEGIVQIGYYLENLFNVVRTLQIKVTLNIADY